MWLVTHCVLLLPLDAEITKSSFDLDTLAKWYQNIAGFVSGRRDGSSTIPVISHHPRKPRHMRKQVLNQPQQAGDLSVLINNTGHNSKSVVDQEAQ